MTGAVRSCRAVVTLQNKNGLHARPAHLWVQTANAFASRLAVRRHDDSNSPPVDGKSIMGVMMLAAEHGTSLELEAVGPDCDQQIRALVELVEAQFGEE